VNSFQHQSFQMPSCNALNFQIALPPARLRDDTRRNQEVLDHLRAEEAFAQEQLEPMAGLIDDLCAEIDAR